MRCYGRLALSTFILLSVAFPAFADKELEALLQKAIKAHGGKDWLTSEKGVITKSKGTLEVMGLNLAFTQENSLQLPKQFKEELMLDVNGKKVPVISVFDGGKGWIKADGKDVEVTDKILEEFKEALYLGHISTLIPLTTKDFDLSHLGEVKIHDKPALGVKVKSKGHRDVNLFFDKENGLVVKTERQIVDPMTGNELQEERFVDEFQEIDGHKVAKKVTVNRDGKKFIEAEVIEVKFVDKLDASVFAKP